MCQSISKISIHAPTRGATIASVHTCVQALISIHAPTRGATCETCNYCHNNRFQSTLPREEQHMNQMHIPIIHNFNPHSHERSDFVPRRISRYIVISIHAPTRGATGWRFRLFANSAISIHAPTRGATLPVM